MLVTLVDIIVTGKARKVWTDSSSPCRRLKRVKSSSASLRHTSTIVSPRDEKLAIKAILQLEFIGSSLQRLDGCMRVSNSSRHLTMSCWSSLLQCSTADAPQCRRLFIVHVRWRRAQSSLPHLAMEGYELDVDEFVRFIFLPQLHQSHF